MKTFLLSFLGFVMLYLLGYCFLTTIEVYSKMLKLEQQGICKPFINEHGIGLECRGL